MKYHSSCSPIRFKKKTLFFSRALNSRGLKRFERDSNDDSGVANGRSARNATRHRSRFFFFLKSSHWKRTDTWDVIGNNKFVQPLSFHVMIALDDGKGQQSPFKVTRIITTAAPQKDLRDRET